MTSICKMILAATVLLSCSTSTSTQSGSSHIPVPLPTVQTLTTLDGKVTYTSDSPVSLFADLSSPEAPNFYELRLGGSAGSALLGGDGRFATVPTLNGQITLPTSKVLQDGAFLVEYRGPDAAMTSSEGPDSGSAQFTFGNGHISGTITTDRPEMSANVDGKLTVTCLVLPSDIPGSGPPAFQVTEGGVGPTLVEDTSFSTAKCKPFAAMAGK